MRLLFDQNLPRRLVNEVSGVFPGSNHVALLELATATDAEIFAYARADGFTMVSNDSDFRQRIARHHGGASFTLSTSIDRWPFSSRRSRINGRIGGEGAL